MDRHYAMKLLREAMRHPERLVHREKFWRPRLFDHYLRRIDDLLFRTPGRGLALARHAPAYAARVAAARPEVSGPVLQLRAHAHLGSAFRATGRYDEAGEAFREALKYETSAPAPIIADLYRRLAYLRLVQHDPECFMMIEKALSIHKLGNLVDRHGLGECLACRGHAFYEFGQPGKSLNDLTAALNHLSLKEDPKPYYAALHNLTTWAVDHGTVTQLVAAQANLEPALSLLNSYYRRHFIKHKFRWLMAIVDRRLGHDGAAEFALAEVQAGMTRLGLPYEVGAVMIDRTELYRKQGRLNRIRPLAEEAAGVFRRLGVEAKAQEALDLLRRADEPEITEGLLQQVRSVFMSCADPMPAPAT